MQLTFRNHRRVQLPVFTNSHVFFLFFQGNATAEQVNVIQHGANHFPSPMKRSDGRRRGGGTHLAVAQRGFEKCHVQTGPPARNALTPPSKTPRGDDAFPLGSRLADPDPSWNGRRNRSMHLPLQTGGVGVKR